MQIFFAEQVPSFDRVAPGYLKLLFTMVTFSKVWPFAVKESIVQPRGPEKTNVSKLYLKEEKVVECFVSLAVVVPDTRTEM